MKISLIPLLILCLSACETQKSWDFPGSEYYQENVIKKDIMFKPTKKNITFTDFLYDRELDHNQFEKDIPNLKQIHKVFCGELEVSIYAPKEMPIRNILSPRSSKVIPDHFIYLVINGEPNTSVNTVSFLETDWNIFNPKEELISYPQISLHGVRTHREVFDMPAWDFQNYNIIIRYSIDRVFALYTNKQGLKKGSYFIKINAPDWELGSGEQCHFGPLSFTLELV